MKKSLFALAALGAFASAAQAQSTVTLYGAFDAGLAYITGVQASTTTAQTAATTSYLENLDYGSWVVELKYGKNL